MPRKAKAAAGSAKADDLKVAQSYNPNISECESDKEARVMQAEIH